MKCMIRKINRKKICNLMICMIFVLLITAFGSRNIISAEAAGEKKSIANVVIFVDFKDTAHVHGGAFPDNCFKLNTQLTFEMFDGDGRNGFSVSKRALKQYMNQISYGKIEVVNIYPQYDGSTFTPLVLKNNADYYLNNDGLMIAEIAEYLKSYDEENLDLYDNDGCVDNLTVVVPYETGNASSEYNGHKAVYGGMEKVNGCLIRNYNVLSEGGVYLGLDRSGTIIHEFLHSLDYPDLYRSSGTFDTGIPVGMWDIMASSSLAVQYPLAYLRSAISGWFSIPTITESVPGYSLYAASATTEDTKDNQAIILKTDYSDTEFFVLEYRKQGNLYAGSEYANELESKIPGSGLIIYRVNTRYSGNFQGPPDMIYVFRPGDEYDSNGYEAGNGERNKSFLSAESGRTSYGSSDLSKSLADGAITYADGTNSGIVISNVGSADGDTITFDISFTDIDETEYWKLISTEQPDNDTSVSSASYLDEDGTMYFIQQKGNTPGSSAYLYQYSGQTWTRVGSAPSGREHCLGKYNNTFYTAYIDSDSYAKLAKWNGAGWTEVYASASQVNEVDMSVGTDGVYMVWVNTDGSKVSACRYGDSGAKELGKQIAASSQYAANPSISAENGHIAVMYREAFNNNKIYVKEYDESADTWHDVSNVDFSANNGMIKIYRNKIYLLKNGTSFGYNECYMYVYDLAENPGTWEQLGSNCYAEESIADMAVCFNGNSPYIVYLGGSSYQAYTMGLVNNQWQPLGSRVTNGIISGIEAYCSNGNVYVTYLSNDTNKVYIKVHQANSTDDTSEYVPTPSPIPMPSVTPIPSVMPTSSSMSTPSAVPTPVLNPTPTGKPGPTAAVKTPVPAKSPELPPGWPFIDVAVNPGNWKYENIKFVYENGIMTGVKTDEFQPDVPLTRAMFASVIYRLAGSPEVTYKNVFSDVPAGKWYSNAIIWAYENKIVAGLGNGRYGINDNITREQVARMLMEFAKVQGYDISDSADFGKFADASDVSRWAADNMRWAVGAGIISGSTKDGVYYMNPKGQATRAECAVMLAKFIKKF